MDLHNYFAQLRKAKQAKCNPVVADEGNTTEQKLQTAQMTLLNFNRQKICPINQQSIDQCQQEQMTMNNSFSFVESSY